MSNNIHLSRDPFNGNQTLGKIEVRSSDGPVLFKCHSLELPWRNNVRRISCIPTGEYPLALRNSPKYGNHIHILDVPNRDLILIHPANFVSQLLGCIAPGLNRIDVNKDGVIDVASSKAAMTELLKYVDNDSKIFIY